MEAKTNTRRKLYIDRVLDDDCQYENNDKSHDSDDVITDVLDDHCVGVKTMSSLPNILSVLFTFSK